MSEYDSPWKEFLDFYLKAFLEFSFPKIHDQIDWSQEVIMRDKELQQIAPESESGLRVVDKLAEVHMRDGVIKWLLIHIEVQSQKTDSFPKRMFVCFYRIADKYDKPLVSLAVLGDDNPNWRPTGYSQEIYGCRIDFRFPTLKLLDYASDLPALEASKNPFATIVLAHLMTMKTAREPHNRHHWKVRLIRSLYERGYEADEIRRLFRVIDWMMDLPTDLEIQFKSDLESIEKEKQMPYVTSVERLAKAEGLEEGREEGVLMGTIRTCQSVLGMTASSEAELQQLSLEALSKIAQELQTTLRTRFPSP